MLVSMANAEFVDSFEVGAPVYVLMRGENVRGLYAGCSHGVESMIVTDPNTLFEMHFPVSFPKGFMKPDPNPSVPPVLVRRPPVPKPPVPPVPPVPPRVDLLEAVAIKFFLSLAVDTATKAKLMEKIERAQIGKYIVGVSCPAFVKIVVDGQPRRASIACALGKKITEIRTQLLQRLGYVPPGTYVRFTWEFARDAMGRLLDQDGEVKIFFNLGGEC
jgi:hypothetical protein